MQELQCNTLKALRKQQVRYLVRLLAPNTTILPRFALQGHRLQCMSWVPCSTRVAKTLPC